MDFLDSILARTLPRSPGGNTRSWPVGKAEVLGWETQWGHDDSRWSPSDAEAEKYATANDVYSLASSRARLLSGLDLKFYKGSGAKKKAIESGRAVELHEWVNPFWTPRRLAWMDEMSMCLWGETYWAMEPPSRESPLGEIWWLKPSRVFPAPHPEGYLAGFWYQYGARGDRIFFSKDELIWFRYPNPLDEMTALSPLAAAKLAADSALAMMTSNRQLFTQGLSVAGLITPPNPDLEFSVDQVDDIEWYLKRKFTGAENAHRWAVLRKEMAFKQMSMSPKDAEFVSGLNMSFRQVARAYGMQAALHNDLEQSSPGDTEALERIEWARTLKPDAQLRSQDIKEQYLPRFVADRGAPDHVEFDFSSVPALQESEGAVWEREAAMLDRSLLTINEWRARRGMPPVPWGDEPWMPLNKGQWHDGQIQIPGGIPGADTGVGMSGGMPQDAMQGGPVPVDDTGVPLPVPPDDEMNPVNQPERVWVSHWEARRLIEAFSGGVRVNGTRRRAGV